MASPSEAPEPARPPPHSPPPSPPLSPALSSKAARLKRLQAISSSAIAHVRPHTSPGSSSEQPAPYSAAALCTKPSSFSPLLHRFLQLLSHPDLVGHPAFPSPFCPPPLTLASLAPYSLSAPIS